MPRRQWALGADGSGGPGLCEPLATFLLHQYDPTSRHRDGRGRAVKEGEVRARANDPSVRLAQPRLSCHHAQQAAMQPHELEISGKLSFIW